MHCSYIAVKGAAKDEVLQPLGLVEGAVADHDEWQALRVGALSNGWVIMISGDTGWASEKLTRSLSAKGALAIGTYMTTTVMGSESYAYRDGQCEWRVLHDPDHDKPLEIEGAPPPELVGVHADLARQQAEDADGGVDYIFEVPMALGAALHGYRPDMAGPDPEPVFRLLKRAKPVRPPPGQPESRRGWLRRVFGLR